MFIDIFQYVWQSCGEEGASMKRKKETDQLVFPIDPLRRSLVFSFGWSACGRWKVQVCAVSDRDQFFVQCQGEIGKWMSPFDTLHLLMRCRIERKNLQFLYDAVLQIKNHDHHPGAMMFLRLYDLWQSSLR